MGRHLTSSEDHTYLFVLSLSHVFSRNYTHSIAAKNVKIGSTTPHFPVKSGVQLRIFNKKLEINLQITKNRPRFSVTPNLPKNGFFPFAVR